MNRHRVTTLDTIWQHMRSKGAVVVFNCPGGAVMELDAVQLKEAGVRSASAAGVWLGDEFIDNDNIYYGEKQ